MKPLDDLAAELLEDPEVRAAYDALAPSSTARPSKLLRELSTPFAPMMALQSSHDNRNPEQAMIEDDDFFWTPEDDEYATERAAMTDRDRAIEAAAAFFDVEVEAELETATLH